MEPHGARILVVDDDPGILHALSRILGRRHHVTCVASGPAALDEAQRLRPDLAVVDIRMPEMTGFEVTRGLKAALRDVDVILMTGNAEEPDDNLIQAIDEGAFYFIQKPFDRRVLLALVTRCLELRRLREEREIFLRRVERELAEARQFQLSLLPPPHYGRAGLSVDARYLACNELAGDIYDYVACDDNAVALLIADVVGHGTSAAMMTGVVKAAFRASHVDDFQPLAVVERVREGIRDFDASRFVTLCCACVDRGRRELTYVNAGHPEPIIRTNAAQPVVLAPTAPLLTSALFDLPCEQATVEFGPGDSILFYTDGVTEAAAGSKIFGQERLVSMMMRGDRGGDLLEEILREVAAFTGSSLHQDDVTLLTLDLAVE
jgi:sigma-B regulation protein RsbU (phosphoserine phosphatase)